MRYFGGGIGHTSTETQPSNEDDLMDVDEVDDNEPEAQPKLADADLLKEIHQLASSTKAEGGIYGERDEVEEPMDSEDDDTDNESMSEDDALSATSSEESDDDLGPEDGEDEGYVDTGYDEL
jgi:hypothetical protein